MADQTTKVVYLVYCVDAEGPLHESLNATFQRIEERFRISIDPQPDTLRKLQQGWIPDEYKEILAGKETALLNLIQPKRLDFASDWGELEERISVCFDPNFRAALSDDTGQGIVYSWFTVDRVGMDVNPRRRSLGYHCVYEFYKNKIGIGSNDTKRDELYWHFHPPSLFLEAHKCANSLSTNHHIQILCRRIIDHSDFPVAFRPGCDVERPDINLFLEQWIPFDYGNTNGFEDTASRNQSDLRGERFNDWSRASGVWAPYHPDLLDYQKVGNLKRYITRCRYAEGRISKLCDTEIEEAFHRAGQYGKSILAVMSHDHRWLSQESQDIYSRIKKIARRFPEIKIFWQNARNALQLHENLVPLQEPVLGNIAFEGNSLVVHVSREMWGAQPFLCFKTHTMQYFHDNFDKVSDNEYTYTFDYLTVALNLLERIGIACNDKSGATWVKVIRLPTKRVDLSKIQLEEKSYGN